MARNKARKKRGTEEILQLKAMGLTCVKTTGNGNCLFHALSDQMYGDQSRHAQLRADTVQYMRDHPGEFKAFVIANPGGGIRRNPKRKNPGALRDTFDPTPPSEADIDTAFTLSLDVMAKGGTYGDNAEIIAFSNKFHVDIRIWSAAIGAFLSVDCDAAPTEDVQTLYIVHHTYEHFSSIRNIDGPATGLPHISVKAISPEARKQIQRDLAANPPIEEWMVNLAMESLPYDANRNMVEQTLKQCRGNINLAVDLLLPETSPETSERSSSIERDPDSDDEKDQKPTKKQDRRQSRPHPLSQNLAVRSKDGDLASPDPHDLSLALKKVGDTKEFDPDETEEEDWKEDGPYHDSESASVSTSASDYSNPDQSQQSTSGVTRFRLSQPKKPQASTSPSTSSDKPKIEYELTSIKPRRVIAKPRRRRLVNGNDRAADLAKKSARNQHMANHATANSQQENAPVQGIKAIKI
ncbi:uncharacterized protein KY384_007780 [Bacidia gigantensis]|uniref:uncharacterized protein n=1 Tax=Bacidia gigantensis TaxID=2732470 RepID=UPI001D037F27|nr:uncharacterized protein KY384_007780 [Bacidia gigantensis]KAG8527627.1 hypothetical protein KY384_007780 [Bacidia gigantensis]